MRRLAACSDSNAWISATRGEESSSSPANEPDLRIHLLRLISVLLFRVPQIPELLCPTNDALNNLVMFGYC
jgi:hypothetical protein